MRLTNKTEKACKTHALKYKQNVKQNKEGNIA